MENGIYHHQMQLARKKLGSEEKIDAQINPDFSN